MPLRPAFVTATRRLRIPALLISAAAWAAPLHAQELLVLGGLQRSDVGGETSYGYTYSYQHNLAENWYASFSYLNEGHVTNHHRDGHSVQLWWRYPFDDRRFNIAIGAGPYRYFDTTDRNNDGSSDDHHGWGVLASVAATWYVNGGPWILQARFNRAQTPSSIKTNTLLIGVGYQLDRGDRGGPVVPPPSRADNVTQNEITVFLGQTIVNTFDSETAFAKAVEYRRGLARYVSGTVSYINEGENSALRRNGVAAQLWLERAFFRDTVTLGVGAGPYYAIDLSERGRNASEAPSRWSGLLTMSASYRINQHWLARVSWNRTVTGYDRDTDVFLAGVGYRF
ncbi:porin family protein [Cupriavidus pauculus]|uniref:porin family protein n=1 Tax=Cupriavidus pauculus TaxID=82633 RepID=UPI001EE37FDB|nr:porin family protein [Cupriavidus pauculus]GJG93168.1 outer membrane beta-barrel protein [Cupriavidus pauculus]